MRRCAGFLVLILIGSTAVADEQRLSDLLESLSPRERWVVRMEGPSGRTVLTPSMRATVKSARRLYAEEEFWEDVALLAEAIRAIGGEKQEQSAERVARETGAAVREIRDRYRPVRPAGFNNILINVGLKKEGFCWHWTRDLMEAIRPALPPEWEMRWGVAREGTLREHNAVVITPAGSPFGSGLVVDAWRHSGRLFWSRVAEDRYPWKELEPDDGFE